MSGRIFVISCIVVALVLIGINHQNLYDYGKWHVPLSQFYDLEYSDVHEAVNNKGHFSTLGDIAIIDEDSIRVTFDNRNGYGYYDDRGVKYWEISEDFILVKTVRVGDMFIAHCNEHGTHKSAQMLRLVGIDIPNGNMTFHHYNAAWPDTVECKYPEIIEHSFGIDWKAAPTNPVHGG